jgi:hypothetical protein
MNDLLVSVLIRVRDEADWLDRTLRSLGAALALHTLAVRKCSRSRAPCSVTAGRSI